jgi:plasmid stability protein
MSEQAMRVVCAKVPPAVVLDLRDRARRNGRSSSGEIREILRQAIYGGAER